MVDFPIKNGSFHSYVKLPEGIVVTSSFHPLKIHPAAFHHSVAWHCGRIGILLQGLNGSNPILNPMPVAV